MNFKIPKCRAFRRNERRNLYSSCVLSRDTHSRLTSWSVCRSLIAYMAVARMGRLRLVPRGTALSLAEYGALSVCSTFISSVHFPAGSFLHAHQNGVSGFFLAPSDAVRSAALQQSLLRRAFTNLSSHLSLVVRDSFAMSTHFEGLLLSKRLCAAPMLTVRPEV